MLALFSPASLPRLADSSISGRNTKKLNIGAWNVRTLLDRAEASRPERRTAIVAKELERYNIDIAALSETRLADEGSLQEIGGGYTFFWKGKPQAEDRIHGVGFAIKSNLLKSISSLPNGINERLMKLRIPLNKARYATIVSAYAPTLTSSQEIKEQFYEDLDQLIKTTPENDKLMILGDFNARVGNDHESWKGVLGRHGVGKINDNGLLLLSKCAEYSLCITNTWYRLADKFKTTWMHPRSKHWHMIDYIIVRQRDIKDVLVTRSMRGAECWTDHRLIRSTMKLHIQPPHNNRPKTIRAFFNVAKLKDPLFLARFQNTLEEKLTEEENPTEDSSQKWYKFKDTVTKTAKEVLGPKTKTHQDWFDENSDTIQTALEAKNKAYSAWQNDPTSASKKEKFKQLQGMVQKELREMQDQWWQAKAAEVQGYADTQNAKLFFSALKTVYGPSRSGSSPLLSSDGKTLIKDQGGLQNRWREHFCNLLNRPSLVNQEALSQVPQQPIQTALDQPPSMDEIIKAIHKTNSGRASGKDGIPAEIYKAAGTRALETFHDILCDIWESESMPDEFRDALIVSLYKNKGSRSDCGNYRGISLLSIAGKIFARVLLNRLITTAEGNLPEAQCGFRPGRSTVDMVFVVRQLQEKCIEQNMPLYFVFIDLTKAFDTVNREALWTMLERIGCPPKFVQIIKLFHVGMTGQVLSGGDTTDAFEITNGVKQGCVLAPVLFNIFFTCMLNHAIKDLQEGVYIKYRLDGSLFDLRRLKAKTKCLKDLIMEALFADDCSLMAHSERDLQVMLNHFSEASKLFGLTISLSKTEVLFQPAPNTQNIPPAIHIEDTKLANVDQFKYLGSSISQDGLVDNEIQARICKASQALGRLKHRVFKEHNIRMSTKISVYKAVVLPSLLYGSETWTLYRRHINKLEQFHTRALRSILGVKWQDKITNLEILDRADCTSIEAILIKTQLRWVGHVIRMDDKRMPKRLLYSELVHGKRGRGRPRKRFKDTIKTNLQWCDIKPNELERDAENRPFWRTTIHKASETFEETRRQRLITAREKRHTALSAETNATDFPCPYCDKYCASRIGLHSHLRKHNRMMNNA